MPRDCTKQCQEGYQIGRGPNPYSNKTIDFAAYCIGVYLNKKCCKFPDKCVKSRGNTYIVSLGDETLKYSCDRYGIVERRYE